MKKHPFNCLALLALPALVSLLYWPTGESGFLGFFGFAVFLRYLWVNPDELFLFTLRRAATAAFLLQCIILAPALAVFYALAPHANPLPQALAISYAVSLIFFSFYHTWLEWKEGRDCA